MVALAEATLASTGSVGSTMMPGASFDLVDLLGLGLDRHVLMDDAQPLLGERDRHVAQ